MPEQGPQFQDRCGQGGQVGQDPAGSERLAVDRFVLANGLEVWHQERPETGTVSLILLVRAGTRHETQHNNGISHFLEHMIFDGSERWDEYEIKDIIRRRGGYFNAQTDYEYTAYETHLLAEDFELALDWLAEIVFHPALPPEKVDRERQVLIQEKGGRSSRLLSLLESWGLGYDLGMAVRRRLFPNSSLTMRVAGEDSSLDRIDREMLADWHRQYYRPNNMALIVAGDVPAGRVRRAVEQYLAGPEPGPVPALPPLPPPPRQNVQVMLKGPHFADRAAVRCGARTVGAAHADVPAFEVLAEVLSNRLTDEVRMRQGLVYFIGAYNVSLSDAGYFVIRTESDAGKMDAIMAAVGRHLRRLCGELVPEAELHEAKALLRGQFALSTQSNASLAWLFADHAVWCRDDVQAPDYYRRIDEVTAQDILRVAQQYFVPDNSYLGIYRPAVTLKTGVLGIAAGLVALAGVMLWERGR